MGIESINEPGQGQLTMLTPVSINEPPVLPARPPEVEPPEVKAHARALHDALADPDELEDELEQMRDDGDIKPLHPPRKKGKHR